MVVNLEPPEVVVSKRDRLVVLLDAYPLMFGVRPGLQAAWNR